MFNVRRGRALLVALAGACAACGLVLAAESRREVLSMQWTELSGGLGLGSHAGVDSGFFAYDARLESLADGALGPQPGMELGNGAGAGGVQVIAPVPRPSSR